MEDPDVIFIGRKEGVRSTDVNYFMQETQRRLSFDRLSFGRLSSQANGRHDQNNNTDSNQPTAVPDFNAAHNAQLFVGYQPPARMHMSMFGNSLHNQFQQGTGANTYPFGVYSAASMSTYVQPGFPFQVISTGQPSQQPVRTRKNAYREPDQNAPGTSTNLQGVVMHPVAAASTIALRGSQQPVRAHKKANKDPGELVTKRRNPPRKAKAISLTAANPVVAKPALAKKANRPAPSSKTKAKSQNQRRRKIQKVDEIPLFQPLATPEVFEFSYQRPLTPEVFEPRFQQPSIPEVFEPRHQQPSSTKVHQPTYQQLLDLQESELVPSTEDASCPVCQVWVLAGEGVILKDCLHSFCRKCLQNAVLCSQTAEVRCPFACEEYSCESHLQDSEIKCLVSSEDYERHLGRSVFQARCQATNAFYCLTPNCTGWCIMESDIRHFLCPVCNRLNCVACAGIHEGTDCGEALVVVNETQDEAKPSINPDQDYQSLVELNDLGIVTNKEKFDCPICFCDIDVGEGVILKDCLHNYCRECLAGTVRHSETVLVKCPFVNEEYACDSFLQEREIKSLLNAEEYEKHLARSLAQVEHQSTNSFHCKTPDCAGWCLFEDDVNEFFCAVCSRLNCLACAAIHEGQNCKQYQELLEFNTDASVDVKKTREYLERQVKKNLAMKCPKCQVIVMKRDGCDWLACSMCRTEICWATKGPRWGPGGKGDTSGGCRCDFKNFKLCHPQCGNCH